MIVMCVAKITEKEIKHPHLVPTRTHNINKVHTTTDGL